MFVHPHPHPLFPSHWPLASPVLFWTVQNDPSKRPQKNSNKQDTEEAPEDKKEEDKEQKENADEDEATKAEREELEKLDAVVQGIVERVEAQDADARLGRRNRERNVQALRAFVGDVLRSEGAGGSTGVFVAGDFGCANVVDAPPPRVAGEGEGEDTAGVLAALALRLNTGLEVGYAAEIVDELRRAGLTAQALPALLRLVRAPRARALVLTEMVVRALKSFVVRKLSREYCGQPAPTYAAYRRFVLDVLNTVAASWDAAGVPCLAAHTRFWTRDVKEYIDALFRPASTDDSTSSSGAAASASTTATSTTTTTGVLDAGAEGAPDYDLRRGLLRFQLLQSVCRHLHVRLDAGVHIELVEGRRADVPERALVECRVPGLAVGGARGRRRLASEHLMDLVCLEALDAAVPPRLGTSPHSSSTSGVSGVGSGSGSSSSSSSSARAVARLQPTTAKLFCLDHVPPAAPFAPGTPPAGADSSRTALALLNLLDAECVPVGRGNCALVSTFAITPAAFVPV